MIEPIEHRPTRQLSFLSILAVATFAVVVALATMIATGGERGRALEQRWYGLLASGNPVIQGTFRTTDLIVDNTSSLGSATATTVTINTNGQADLFSTFVGSNADGQNIWIGGGGQSSVGDVVNTFWGSHNISLGPSAMANCTTCYQSIGIGDHAMGSTTGGDNVAVGDFALMTNSTGGDNVAIDTDALTANTTGSSNIAINGSSLRSNTSGSFNIALGASALRANTSGSNNVAIDSLALRNNTLGANNIAIGLNAMFANVLGNANIALGQNALQSNVGDGANAGINNIAIGVSSLAANDIGFDNIAIGVASMLANTGGTDNIAMGRSSLGQNTSGTFNIALGFDAISANLTGVQNIALGALTLQNVTGNGNVAVGVTSAFQITSGTENTVVGDSSGKGITTGGGNSILGANVIGLAAGTTSKIILAEGLAGLAVWLSPTAPTSVDHGALGTGSSNTVGNVTGIGANTSVVLTYSTGGFPNRSWCQATPNGSGTLELIVVTNSATAPTFSCFNTTTGVAANCVDFTYWCTGQ